jgi:hypothetical protein
MRNAQELLQVIRAESEVFGRRLATPETAEALRAFAAKRGADFSRF